MKSKTFCFSLITILFSGWLNAQHSGFLGISYRPDFTHKTPYFLIVGIMDGSPAEKAGFKAGQRIVSFNGKEIFHADYNVEKKENPFKGAVYSTATFIVTGTNDLKTRTTIQVTYSLAPTNPQLMDPPWVSNYFPIRLYNAFEALKSNDPRLKKEPSKNGEKNQWLLRGFGSLILNDRLEGTFSEWNIAGEKSNEKILEQQVQFDLCNKLESDDLADNYFNDLKDSLKAYFKKEMDGPFKMTEEAKPEESPSRKWKNEKVEFKNASENRGAGIDKNWDGKYWKIIIRVFYRPTITATEKPLITSVGFPKNFQADLQNLSQHLFDLKLGLINRKEISTKLTTAIVKDPVISWDHEPALEIKKSDIGSIYEIKSHLLIGESNGKKADEWYQNVLTTLKNLYGQGTKISETRKTIKKGDDNPFGSFGNTKPSTATNSNDGLEEKTAQLISSPFEYYIILSYSGGSWNLDMIIDRVTLK